MSAEPDLFSGSEVEWDEFVRSQSGWTHFHLYGWRALLERVFGHECPYLAVRDGSGRLTGVLPLVRVKSLIFGHYLVSQPFLNYGGPLGSDDAVRLLAGSAVALAERGDVKLLELRSRTPLPIDLPPSHRKITVVLDLPRDPDLQWKNLDSKLRSQVRRPQKEGVTVRFGPEQVAPFFSVFSRHMHHLGTPALPVRFFQTIAETFPEDGWFGCAYLGSTAVACGAGFRWGQTGEFEMTWASALSDYNRIAPNMLLYWAFIERAVREGLAIFNFGRCTPGGGTHRFKSQWGGRDEQLWWYQRSPGGVASTPSPDSGPLSWGPRIWKRLPLGVATALGPRIVRSIP